MITIASLLLGLAFAETIDIYVSPMKVENYTMKNNFIVTTDPNAAFYFTGLYADTVKKYNGHGGFESVRVVTDGVRVYNEETIRFLHGDCDYKKDPLGCSVKNEHYYVEASVIISDDQLVIRATFYDKDATIINTNSKDNNKAIFWIRQQEVTVMQTREGTITHFGKEELPLKWEVPYRLFENTVRQTIMGLFAGVQIK